MTLTTPTSHYIVLLQTNESSDSRRYNEYNSMFDCMEGISKLYDDFLKYIFPEAGDIVYDMAALVKFLQSLKDISCLVYNKKLNMYKPQGKEWIMQELYKHLMKNKDL